MKYVVDTNALITNCAILDELQENNGIVIVPYSVLQELDRIKTEPSERGYNARKAVRKLKNSEVQYDLTYEEKIDNKSATNDDRIVECAARNEATMVSGDYLVLLKSKAKGLETLDAMEHFKTEDEYLGYSEFELSDDEVALYYQDPKNYPNDFDVLVNEYCVLYDIRGKLLESLKWDGESFQKVKIYSKKSPAFASDHLGGFVPKDVYQRLAVDSLINNQMTMLRGKAGTGKSLLALSYAFSEIEKGKTYDKLICFVNPVSTKGATKLGYLPGDRNEKLLESSVGSTLCSKLGAKSEVEALIADGKLIILPMSEIRGYDTTGMKAIVYVLESQNLDINLMKLAIQRVGNDCKIILDGDFRQQVDMSEFAGDNNGMRRASEVFRGQDFYGEVELVTVFRSKLAKIADNM